MKREVRFFVSYAHTNSAAADDFLRRLREQLKPSLRYDYFLWRDTALLIGEDWEREIQEALGESDFGLLLLSPAFLYSEYIAKAELPTLIAGPVMPVMIEAVSLLRHDMRGLSQKQIFALIPRQNRQGRAFADCGTRDRRRFVEQLFEQIELRLDKLLAGPTRSL